MHRQCDRIRATDFDPKACGYINGSNVLDTVDKANIALEAMISLRTFYGVP